MQTPKRQRRQLPRNQAPNATDKQLVEQVKEASNLERAKNKSGFKHVYPEGKKYKAMIKENGQLLDLGLYDLPRLAAAAVYEFKRTQDTAMLRGRAIVKKKKRRRAAVSEAVAREVAACQKWQCAGSSCPLPDEHGNLPAEFEIDHINGDRGNSLITNLQALCGICHNKKSSHERQLRLHALVSSRKR